MHPTNAAHTIQLVEVIVKPYAAQCAEYLSTRTTYNEAAKRGYKQCKSRLWFHIRSKCLAC